jgi:uncharacterized protein (TIGR03790 family)
MLVLLLALVTEVRSEQSPVDSTIVIYNKASPDSVELAKFYAENRGIAQDHLVGLDCPTEEEITREQYDATMAEPLREAFKQRHWWALRESPGEARVVTASAIHFVAVIKGVPLKIRRAADYSGDQPRRGPIGSLNEASVDSELAVLALFSRQISGETPNPYFQSFHRIGDLENSKLLLVCRLDAPTAATVRSMIVDSIATEKNGLWGRAYVDGAQKTGIGLVEGDQWLTEITSQFHKFGIPVVYDDTPATFPAAYPMTDCALYYGWYAASVAGPFTRSSFHFVPGAIAVHIHSLSARTLRDPDANWIAPLLSKGAAASLGNVYEPYLQLTSQLDIFNNRLLHGFTFAESAYMSIRALSWMSVMVGDPLYRPYASWMQSDAQDQSAKSETAPVVAGSVDPGHGTSWKMYHEFAVKNGTRPVSEFRAFAGQAAVRERNCPMMEDLGSMEARDGHLAAATSDFEQARTCYTSRDDILRVALEEADAWIKQKKPKQAIDLIRSVLQTASHTPAASLLRKMEQDLSAVPAASPNKP